MPTRVSVRSPGVLHQLLAHEQTLRQNLPAKLQALRLQRQWSALRAERELTQLLLALIRVQIQGGEALMAKILAELIGAGVEVVTCSRVRSRLEDVYDRISADRVN